MSGARVKCHRCGQWLGVIDWSDPAAAMISDRIVAGHAVDCIPPRSKPTCKVPGCTRAVLARGWCKKHWTRWSRHGNPLAVASSRKQVTVEALPKAQIAAVPPAPPEPAVDVRKGIPPAICERCGKPYAADAGLPEDLLRAALAVHRCKRVAA